MSTDQPTTPRAALLAFAAYLDQHDMPAPMPSSVYAQLVREYAERYSDDDDLLTPAEIAGLSVVTQDELKMRLAARNAALSPVVELTAELAGTQALDVDQQLRVEALQAAAHWHIGATIYPEGAPDPTQVLHAARVFEAYLRGDQ